MFPLWKQCWRNLKIAIVHLIGFNKATQGNQESTFPRLPGSLSVSLAVSFSLSVSLSLSLSCILTNALAGHEPQCGQSEMDYCVDFGRGKLQLIL